MLEGLQAFTDFGLRKPATWVVADADQGVVELSRRCRVLLEHSVQQPEDAVADDVFVAGKAPEACIAGE